MPIHAGLAQLWVTVTAGATTVSTWSNWNQAWTFVGTTSSTGTTSGTGTYWGEWNTQYTQDVPEETAEQRERRAAEHWELVRREQAARFREQEAEREAARLRAEELLLEMLSDEQAESWRQLRWFTVRGSRTGRAYQIRRGVVGNVYRMAEDDPGQAETNYCAHPPGGLPDEDVCLAQLLLLSTDEDEFLRVANAHPVRRERHLEAVA